MSAARRCWSSPRAFSSSPPSVRARTPFCIANEAADFFQVLLDAFALRVELVVAVGFKQERQQESSSFCSSV